MATTTPSEHSGVIVQGSSILIWGVILCRKVAHRQNVIEVGEQTGCFVFITTAERLVIGKDDLYI